MRLAFLSIDNPFERSSWSGIPYYALRELQRRFTDVEVINTPVADKVLQRLAHLRKVGVSPTREPMVARYFARHIGRRLRHAHPDVVVAINAVHKLVGLHGRYPAIYCSDGFFSNIVDYYPQFANLSPRARRNGDRQQEQLLASKASICLSSDWAARTAASYYDAPRDRFQVVPFGANFDVDPPARPARPASGPLKLLFVGYDWARKGGDLVLEVFVELRRRLPDAELHIAGCTPEAAQGIPGVIVHGQLDKGDPVQAAKFESLFRESNFFFMPSRQEAYGLVYCEACAFALPPIAADTGGVGTIVHHGVNGLLMPSGAGPIAYVDAITAVWSKPAAYRAMQLAARDAYETRLNWRVWGDAIEHEAVRLTGGAKGRARDLGDHRFDRDAERVPVVDAGMKLGLGGR